MDECYQNLVQTAVGVEETAKRNNSPQQRNTFNLELPGREWAEANDKYLNSPPSHQSCQCILLAGLNQKADNRELVERVHKDELFGTQVRVKKKKKSEEWIWWGKQKISSTTINLKIKPMSTLENGSSHQDHSSFKAGIEPKNDPFYLFPALSPI